MKADRPPYAEQVLSLRTPRSRAGAFPSLQATQPLLALEERDAEATSSVTKSSHLPIATRVLSYFPLVTALLCALALFLLTAISYRRPDLIHWIIGDSDEASNSAYNQANMDDLSSPLHHSANSTEHGGNQEAGLTIDYSNYTTFPLTTMEYAAECWKINQKPHKHGAFWSPGYHGVYDVKHADLPGVCASTITYLLDGEVGLAADLAMIAQLAGLARERNRTFLIDDTYWNRGRWLDFFEDVRRMQPGPEPGCLPPPPEELVACPRLARHWVVTSHTAKFHMVHEFDEAYQDPYRQSVDRQRPIFEMGRVSLAETIRPNARIVRRIKHAQAALNNQSYIGVHIRRGDQKAMSWRYHQGYVPIGEFVSAVQQTLSTSAGVSSLYVASDSAWAILEFSATAPRSWRIHVSERRVHDDKEKENSMDQDHDGYFQQSWHNLPFGQRFALTEEAIVDLALVTGIWSETKNNCPQAVVCTLSSHICKIAAMALGWETAMENKAWVEIDNRGSIEPIWDAFKLYH